MARGGPSSTSCHATVGRRATSLYTRLLKNQIELGVGSTNFQDNQNILQGINTIIVCSKHRHTPYDHCSSKHKTDQQYKILLTPDNIFLLDPCAQSRGHDLVRTLPTYYLTDNANILISISTTLELSLQVSGATKFPTIASGTSRPMGWHHNWSYFIGCKFSHQVAPLTCRDNSSYGLNIWVRCTSGNVYRLGFG